MTKIDPETGEVIEEPTQPKAPRVTTLDQIINRANGGEYRDHMPRIIESFMAALSHHASEHGELAKGTLTLTLKTTIDPHGEVTVELKPKIELPNPPAEEGRARLAIDPDGVLRTHAQAEMPLLRDIGNRTKTPRDTRAQHGE